MDSKMYIHTTNILFNFMTEHGENIRHSVVLPLYTQTPKIELQKIFDSIKSKLQVFFINTPSITIYHKNEYLTISVMEQECEVLAIVKVVATDLKEHYKTLLRISPKSLMECFTAAL